MKNYTFQLDKKVLTINTEKYARLANASVFLEFEGTTMLTTVVSSKKPSTLGYFPLQVVFQERLYAAGKIPGGFLKREGRPSDHEILTGRIIDRSLRPLFPKDYNNEIQIVVTVLAYNDKTDLRTLGLFSASLATLISNIPFNGPVSGCSVNGKKDKLSYFVSEDIEEVNDLNMFVAGTEQKINMLEADCKQSNEKFIIKGIAGAHKQIKSLNKFQKSIQKEIGKTKIKFDSPDTKNMYKTISSKYNDEFNKIVNASASSNRSLEIELLINEIVSNKDLDFSPNNSLISGVVNEIYVQKMRDNILYEKKRPDGRSENDLRKLYSEIDILDMVHGSGLFERGETQVLSILTLGSLKEGKMMDSIQTSEDKTFMHHYNFPPFSVGEPGRIGFTSRREVGHGALGEKALKQILPSTEQFPYTVRLVAEVLTSNGSTSQAAICAGTLALMSGGVPIKAPIAGVAMGLVRENKKQILLTDISGLEDHIGDMDFKVSGSRSGVCSIQLDICIDGLDIKTITEALDKAKEARIKMLDVMEKTINKPREELSKTAPKFINFKIKKDKIRVVVGQGGKTINEIIDNCGDVKIDINDNGLVNIYHNDKEMINKASEWIKSLIWEPKMHEVYDAKIMRIEKYGAFAKIGNTKFEGLIHISKISKERVENVESVLKMGQKVKAKVSRIDEKGRIQLSMIL